MMKQFIMQSYFWERGRTLYGGTWYSIGGLKNHVILSYPYKFMSGYLYFPNSLKDIKDHIQADIISCKTSFQLMVTVFKDKLNLQLPLILYSSIRFVFESVFIPELIAENRFGAWLEISDKFTTKFNRTNDQIM